jgi:hypothetical protein
MWSCSVSYFLKKRNMTVNYVPYFPFGKHRGEFPGIYVPESDPWNIYNCFTLQEFKTIGENFVSSGQHFIVSDIPLYNSYPDSIVIKCHHLFKYVFETNNNIVLENVKLNGNIASTGYSSSNVTLIPKPADRKDSIHNFMKHYNYSHSPKTHIHTKFAIESLMTGNILICNPRFRFDNIFLVEGNHTYINNISEINSIPNLSFDLERKRKIRSHIVRTAIKEFEKFNKEINVKLGLAPFDIEEEINIINPIFFKINKEYL